MPLDGNYVVESAAANVLTLRAASTVAGGWTSSSGNLIVFDGNNVFTPEVRLPNSLVTVGPFVVPSENYSEVWLDFQAPARFGAWFQLSEKSISQY